MFWNEQCQEISDLLWNPGLFTDRVPEERVNFRCDHPDITFGYYSDGFTINPAFNFKPLETTDMVNKKIKLFDSLMTKERKRFSNELDNKKSKLTLNEKFEKHIDFESKIDGKLEKLDGFIRSRRVRILPTKIQKEILQKWFHDATMIYNHLVGQFTHVHNKIKETVSKMDIDDNEKRKLIVELLKTNTDLPLNFQDLRSVKMKDCQEDFTIPYCVIADVIKEFITGVKSNITKLASYQVDDFSFKMRKHNRCFHSLPLESKYTYPDGFYTSILGSMKPKDDDFNWSDVQHDYKLIYDRDKKRYYVHVPKYVYRKEDEFERYPIASMDPGERTFQTLYGLNHYITIGDNLRKNLKKRLLKIDYLKSKLNRPGKYKYNKRLGKRTRVKKQRYKKAIRRHHNKMKDLMTELHYKTAIYLCENYERILVTNFSSKKVSNKEGDLQPMSKRVLGKISHYTFRQRLKQKCEEYGCQYLEDEEIYTSKTCSCCGNVNHQLGDDKIYDCRKCEIILDRDVNAAMNIFIKHNKKILV